MFDLMYEEFYNPETGRIERRKLTPDDVVRLLQDSNSNRSDLLDLNVVYKRQTRKSLLAIRLYSFLSDKKDSKGNIRYGSNGLPLKERVVKFQFESGMYDQNRQQGNRMTSYMKFNMDVEEFAYFCEIMKSGKVPALIKRNEAKAASEGKRYAEPAFEIYKEVEGAGKRFKIYKGSSADMCIETSQEPVKGGRSNGQATDSVKVMHGLSLKEAGELGAMGALALETLNMWYAFGKAEENLVLINTRPKKEKQREENAGVRTQVRRRDNAMSDYGFGQQAW